MDDFEKLLQEELKNPAFQREWDKLEIEYAIKEILIRARVEKNLRQKQLAELTGIRQSNISRIENGNCVPSIHPPP